MQRTFNTPAHEEVVVPVTKSMVGVHNYSMHTAAPHVCLSLAFSLYGARGTRSFLFKLHASCAEPPSYLHIQTSLCNKLVIQTSKIGFVPLPVHLKRGSVSSSHGDRMMRLTRRLCPACCPLCRTPTPALPAIPSPRTPPGLRITQTCHLTRI